MEKIIIRRSVAEDYEVIGGLLVELLKQHQNGRPDLFEPQEDGSGKYSRKEFETELADGRTVAFSAVCGEKVVGYLICKIIEERANPVLKNVKTLYLDDLCVSPEFRGCGAGKALMNAAEAYARENGFYNITLNVWEFNGSAKGFYDRLGYTTQRREMEKVLK